MKKLFIISIFSVSTCGYSAGLVNGTLSSVPNSGSSVTASNIAAVGGVMQNGNATNVSQIDSSGRLVSYSIITITTNRLLVTNDYYFQGAGSAGYTTPFHWNGTINGYTNATKVFGSVNDSGYYYEVGTAPLSGMVGNDDYSPSGVIPSPASANPTNWTSLDGQVWSADVHGIGTTTGYFGTNLVYTTNTITIFTNANFLNPVGNYIYASPNGNDLTAIRGEASRPFRTMDGINTVLQPGDTIICSSGFIGWSNSIIPLTTKSITISGAGAGVTLLNLASFVDNYCISSLTLSNCYFGGCTNVVLNNVNFSGAADCLTPDTNIKWDISVFNSKLTTAFDAYADTTTLTNSSAYLYNCVMIGADRYSKTGASFCPELITLGGGRLKMVGGAIINETLSGGNNPCCVNANINTAYAEFYNVYFQPPSISGKTNWVIYNNVGATIKLYNCIMNTNLIYDPSNKVSIINGYQGGNYTGTFSGNGSGLTNINISTATGALPANSPKTPTTVSLTGSIFTFSNATPSILECYFSGSVAYAVTKNGVGVFGSLAADGYFQLQPTNICAITYTVAPTFYTNSLY